MNALHRARGGGFIGTGSVPPIRIDHLGLAKIIVKAEYLRANFHTTLTTYTFIGINYYLSGHGEYLL
jgi:hypothetical protein